MGLLNVIWPYLLAAALVWVVGFILGLYHGAQMGVRIFAHDAIVLAIRTQDANPEKFAALKTEALQHKDFEADIQKALEAAGRKRRTIRQELAEDAEYQRQLREQAHG